MSSNFLDYLKIFCKSGDGGAGKIHCFKNRRSKRSFSDGGNGGNGGNIIIKGNKRLKSLNTLKHKKHNFAENGEIGGSNCKNGSNGKDLLIEVPLGTTIKDINNNILLKIHKHNKNKLLFKGGKGGKGNSDYNFRSKLDLKGSPGKSKWLILEFIIYADVGIIGFPNSGKSTLISKLAALNTEIKDYSFTTTLPNIGIVKYNKWYTFLILELPGIVKGSNKGKGLGINFLKHTKYNKVILIILSVESKNILQEYNIILEELKNYDNSLLLKQKIILISKSDILSFKKIILQKFPTQEKTFFISFFNPKEIKNIKNVLYNHLK
ncbi:GTPase Obg [Candidatus Karelsulcia muelleri]|uniref:Obg family GTPase CgtA n=1 Tax=Candidatus Karelsulcia muelleri TaxID=336810 RepID=UPI001FF623FF|nr:Obg family GTPase CgtA [Candidatus Karelsulcia muelleri]UOQ27754.1 GTPase Obg [Candidatus Karelsulcia muelleri]